MPNQPTDYLNLKKVPVIHVSQNLHSALNTHHRSFSFCSWLCDVRSSAEYSSSCVPGSSTHLLFGRGHQSEESCLKGARLGCFILKELWRATLVQSKNKNTELEISLIGPL